ncbi:MAG: radical SAM protein [Candidatus Neomarinimicrobiota bacterium]
MLTEIHFLLTYTCNYECDHCFLYCGPNSEGTFTIKQLRNVFAEIPIIGSIEKVYFEGGEPFLFYPLLLEGTRIARNMGLNVGIVTNSYWATSAEDAELWLKQLLELGVADIFISDDSFHRDKAEDNPAGAALAAAENLGLAAYTICIEEPSVQTEVPGSPDKGSAIVGGSVVFRGRAVEKLTTGLPTRAGAELTQCPYEDLETPTRVHIDPFGNVHFCQGLSIGNIRETPLSTLLRNYVADSHPICGPLVKGGPALLARTYNVKHAANYVDECHFCYLTRLALIERFPQYLAPRQAYGLDQGS